MRSPVAKPLAPFACLLASFLPDFLSRFEGNSHINMIVVIAQTRCSMFHSSRVEDVQEI